MRTVPNRDEISLNTQLGLYKEPVLVLFLVREVYIRNPMEKFLELQEVNSNLSLSVQHTGIFIGMTSQGILSLARMKVHWNKGLNQKHNLDFINL